MDTDVIALLGIFDFLLSSMIFNKKSLKKQKLIALNNRKNLLFILVELGTVGFLWEVCLKPLWSYFAKQRSVQDQGRQKI